MVVESRTERNKRELRRRILLAARDLFVHDGVDATKVETICERADIALRTFFNHFPSKKALVHQLAVEAALGVAARLRAVCEQKDSTPERLELFFMRSGRSARERPTHRELLSHLIAAHDRPEDLRHARDAMLALVHSGIERGDVTRAHTPETLADVVLGTYYRIITDYTQQENYPIEDHLRRAARFLADALAPRPEERDAWTGSS